MENHLGRKKGQHKSFKFSRTSIIFLSSMYHHCIIFCIINYALTLLLFSTKQKVEERRLLRYRRSRSLMGTIINCQFSSCWLKFALLSQSLFYQSIWANIFYPFCLTDGTARILPHFLSLTFPVTCIHAGAHDNRHCERERMWQATLKDRIATNLWSYQGSNPSCLFGWRVLYPLRYAPQAIRANIVSIEA